MEYEVVDSQGNKKWITQDEAKNQGLLKRGKKGAWIPAVTGTLGGVIGSILGPLGAAGGAFAGTGAGIALQDVIYGRQNALPTDYTGKTKYGFPELSESGRKAEAMKVVNATKDASVAGATAYLGAKIPGIGPAGKGVLPAVGRIGTKTTASALLGAGTGFASGDIEEKTVQERINQAKAGATVGGVLGFGGSVIQEGMNVVRNRDDIAKQLANTYKTTKDRISLDKKIWNKVEEAAQKNPTEIKNSDIVDKLITKAKADFGESGTRYKSVMEKLLSEDRSKVYNTQQAIKIGANIPYSPKTSSTQKWIDVNKKDIISQFLPKDVADWKAVYAMNKDLKSIPGWILRKLGLPAAILLRK